MGGHAMTTRRELFKGIASLAFCSCAMLDAAHAQQPARTPNAARRPVTIKGKRIKTIDVHAHCLFHEAVALMGDDAAAVTPRTKGAQQMFVGDAMDGRLKSMDAMAIDMEILSINPFWYRKDRDTSEKIVKIN